MGFSNLSLVLIFSFLYKALSMAISLPSSPKAWIFKVVPKAKFGKWLEFNRIPTHQAEDSSVKQVWVLQWNSLIECINNSFDAHRTASISFVFNNPNPQINGVLAGTEVLVSHDVTRIKPHLDPRNHPSFEQIVQWITAWSREVLGCNGVCILQITPWSHTHSTRRSPVYREGWCARSQGSGEPGPCPGALDFKGLLVLCGLLNVPFVILGVFSFIPTAPHQLTFIIATPILWTRHESQTSMETSGFLTTRRYRHRSLS